jgi:hypothetical protein
MAHLWVRDHEHRWAALPLDAALPLELERVPAPGFDELGVPVGSPAPVLAPVAVGRRAEWALFAGAAVGVSINGVPLRTGLRVLADRDEARLGAGAGFFFSAERLARVEPLPSFDRALRCARCQQPIETGCPAVLCPGCDRWFHQDRELDCWTHLPKCSMCSQPTALDSGFRWTPEDL